MDIIEERPHVQITTASAGFDKNGFVAITEESSPLTMPYVETSGVGVLEPSHCLDKICRRSLDKEMVVVSHQYPRPNPDAAPFTALTKRFQEEFLVRTVPRGEDAVASIAPGHHVVEGSLVFDANLARHGTKMQRDGILSNPEFVP